MANPELRKKEVGKERGKEGRGRRLLVTHGPGDDSWHNLTSSEAMQHPIPSAECTALQGGGAHPKGRGGSRVALEWRQSWQLVKVSWFYSWGMPRCLPGAWPAGHGHILFEMGLHRLDRSSLTPRSQVPPEVVLTCL